MPRIKPIDVEQADGKAKSLLENANKALGMTPNLMRTLAHSPAALEAYLGFGKALGGGSLSSKLREQIALTPPMQTRASTAHRPTPRWARNSGSTPPS